MAYVVILGHIIELQGQLLRRFYVAVKTVRRSTKDKRRLRWACRRGMLELDVLFEPFVDQAYDELSEEQKRYFAV